MMKIKRGTVALLVLPANSELVEASAHVIVNALMRIKRGSVVWKLPSVTCKR